MGEHILSFHSFPLLRHFFLYVETYSTVQKLVFDDTDTNIQRVCVHNITFCENELETVFRSLIFCNFSFSHQKPQIKVPQHPR